MQAWTRSSCWVRVSMRAACAWPRSTLAAHRWPGSSPEPCTKRVYQGVRLYQRRTPSFLLRGWETWAGERLVEDFGVVLVA